MKDCDHQGNHSADCAKPQWVPEWGVQSKVSDKARLIGRTRRAWIRMRRVGMLGFAKEMVMEYILMPLSDMWVWFGKALHAAVGLMILKPTTAHLPASWVNNVVKLFCLVYAFIPFWGLNRLRRIRKALAKDWMEAIWMARDWVARPLLDANAITRLLHNKEDFRKKPVVEINRGILAPLISSGCSFIVATAHFTREAAVLLITENAMPYRINLISNPPFRKFTDPQAFWLTIHLGQMLRLLPMIRNDIVIVHSGFSNLVKKLIRTLKAPGNVVGIMVDAPWHNGNSGSFSRPFAGRGTQRFATGAARLARATQCPIVLCIPFLDKNGITTFEWVRVIDPPTPKDEKADVRITNMLLDDIEKAIARYPTQYVNDFLGDRRWNRDLQRWE